MDVRKFLATLACLAGGCGMFAQNGVDSTALSELKCLEDKTAADWIESMEVAQRRTLLLEKAGQKPEVAFAGYRYIGVIGTDEQAEAVKKAMVADSVFTLVRDDKGRLAMVTLAEIRKKYPSGVVPFPCVLNLKDELQHDVQKGMVQLELWWKHGGKMYPSIALVGQDGKMFFDTIGHLMPVSVKISLDE